ncbi:MAG: hypothetical protein ACXWIU_03435 [Limisphaerales bacterium]
MPDQIVENSSSQPLPAQNSDTAMQAQIVGLFAAGIIISFFLPWLNFLGFKASGFELVQKYGGSTVMLWAIPFFGVVALMASISKTNLKAAAPLAGIMPILALCYGLYDSGTDLTKLLDFGAYVGVGSGIAMLLFSLRIK